MLIDWPTVIFQIINFLILIGLLKRFLYGPIIKAMDEREQQVAARLAKAAKAEKEAAERTAALAKEQEDFAKARAEMLLQARREVEDWKDDALKRLQAEVDEKRESWNSVLASERETFLRKLKRLISRNVLKIARKALADLADDQLEAKLISTFVAKFDDKEEGFDTLLGLSASEIKCITGFPLAAPQKEQLEKVLRPYLSKGGKLLFQEDNDLGFGVRLLSDGQKWEWNLNRYMIGLEDEIHNSISSLSGVHHAQ